MMACNKSEIGSFECAVRMKLPYLVGLPGEPKTETKTVSIDKCLLDEIMFLWNIDIKTTGCCCGHGVRRPFISVLEDFDGAMLSLGYERYLRDEKEITLGLGSDTGYFIPKSRLGGALS